jgi:hypothetical protein
MKYLLALVIPTLLVITSCKKNHDDGVDFGCIEQAFFKAKDHAISGADVSTVDKLFSKTTIDNSKLIYFRFDHDTVQDEYAPYTKHDRKTVWASQYERGITIFNQPRVFLFLDDTLSVSKSSNTNVSAMLSVLDTIPNSSLPRVRKLFRNYLERYFPIDNSSNRIDYTDTCFKAEFGWLKQIVGSRGQGTEWYKVWRVSKKNSTNNDPEAYSYFHDITGEKLEFYYLF